LHLDQKSRLAKIVAIRGMIQNFAAGAEFREICDCRDRREKFTALSISEDEGVHVLQQLPV